MKGVVFTEFLEFIEDKFGFDISDDMIENSKTSTEGVYTQAGNYPFEDMLSMVQTLSKLTNVPLGDLVQAYGEHLFLKLISIYPKPISVYTNTFDFVSNVEKVVHPEVKKLYPDSDLPSFIDPIINDNVLEITYVSNKPLMDFAKGLIIGCAKYYNEKIEISYDLIESTPRFKARFTVTKS